MQIIEELRIAKGERLVRATDFSTEIFPVLDREETPAFSLDSLLSALQPMFFEIKHPVPSAWGEHIPFLFSLFELVRPRRYVELGVHNGGSFLAACQIARSSNTGTTCIAIDNWVGEAHAGFHGEEIFHNFRDSLNEYSDFAGYIRAEFDKAVDNFEDGSIDILHIDGFHTARAVRHDFETWLRKLSPKGLVLFHDTNEYRTDFGVWRFWRKVKERYQHLEFGHGHGLGVLVVGEDSAITKPIEGSSFSLTSGWANEFLQILYGGAGQVSWKTARDRRALNESNSRRQEKIALQDKAAESSLSKENARMAKLEKALADIQNSTSWKITKPIRALKRMISRA